MDERPDGRRSFRARLAAFLALALLATALFLWFDADTSARAAARWAEALGWWAAPLFVLLHAAAVVLLVPGAVFPLMAGFFFGPVLGAVCSTFGKTLGALAAFSIARYLIGGHRRSRWLARLREGFPKYTRVEDLVVAGGWKSLATIRLIPAVPFKLSSYLLGWSRVGPRDFLIGTFIGTIPYSITNAYLGSLAQNLTLLGNTPVPRSTTGTLLYAAAAIVALTAATLAGWKMRRALAEPLPSSTDQQRETD